MENRLDHKTFLGTFSAADRARLTARSDAKGLAHLAGHLALIAALAVWVGLAAPLWGLALPLLGLALVFLFTLQHECTHQTPFASSWLNELVGHGAGLILVQPFWWFRAFHMAHHKHTNDPEHDPELASPHPHTGTQLFWHLTTLGYWQDKLLLLWKNAFGTPNAAYIPERLAPLLRWEARIYLTVYTAALCAMVLALPILFWIWLVPICMGFPVLRLYLLAEHGRCPPVANMFENTRTTMTHRMVRFLAWNMPFHAEHHAWPSVPFHMLPDLHQTAAPHLVTTADGYREITADLLRHAAASSSES